MKIKKILNKKLKISYLTIQADIFWVKENKFIKKQRRHTKFSNFKDFIKKKKKCYKLFKKKITKFVKVFQKVYSLKKIKWKIKFKKEITFKGS